VSPPATVRVTIEVHVDQHSAFTVFTDEIDQWYKRGPHDVFDASRCVGIRFEPYAGGRLVEVYDADSGEGRAIGHLTVWDPPRRLVMVDGRDTEMEVTFEPAGAATRVTLEHRGLEKLAPAVAEKHARFGWQLVFRWYEAHMSAARTTPGSA
jgi:hypothetical protein